MKIRGGQAHSCWDWGSLLARWWPRQARLASAREVTEAEADLLRGITAAAPKGSWVKLSELAHLTTALDLYRQGLVQKGLLEESDQGLRLTSAGRERGLGLLRSHRLLERHLADTTGLPAKEWHRAADSLEHGLDGAALEALDRKLGHPRFDPHGDPIPLRDGELPELASVLLSEVPLGAKVEVLHVEDEPEENYQKLVASGFVPGQRLELVGRGKDAVRVRWGKSEIELPIRLAGLIAVRLSPDPISSEVRPLSELNLGEEARIVELSPASRGLERRRLLDLGFVPGTVICAELRPPSGEPTAYRIRGTLIALRRQQADSVRIEPLERKEP